MRSTGLMTTWFCGSLPTELPPVSGTVGTFEFQVCGSSFSILTGYPVPVAYLDPERELIEGASYQVSIIDIHTGDILALIDHTVWENLRYSRTLQDTGLLMMSIPADHAAATYLGQVDQLIEVTRYETPATGLVEETYLLRYRELFQDEDGLDWLVIGGLSLTHLLKRRVINPEDDPAAVAGYSIKDGPADDVMTALVQEQLGSLADPIRQVTTLSLTTSPGLGNPVGGRWRFENLHDILAGLSESSGMDFAVERTSGNNFLFTAAVIGEDRTLSTNLPLGQPHTIFSPTMNTMLEPSFMEDRRNETTFLYLLGPGQGDERTIYEVNSARGLDSPLNRIEMAHDAQMTDEDNPVEEILTRGAAELAELGPTIQLEFDIPFNLYPHYRDKWDLGDAISAVWDTIRADLRIMEVEVTLSAQEDITVNMELVRWT